MKQIAFVLFFTTLALSGCKKETPKIEKTGEIHAAPVPCTGNYWETTQSYYSTYFNHLVYNNKLYLFLYKDNVIKTYNGTNWTALSSEFPDDISTNMYKSFSFQFAIGNKGYFNIVITGISVQPQNVNPGFYEYDFIANTWTEKAKFPGNSQGGGQSTFTVGNKGYVIGGAVIGNNSVGSRETWEYNPQNNTWTQKADTPGLIGKMSSTGFSIGDKGYLLNGYYIVPGLGTACSKTLLQYNPATNQWSTKAFFPGQERRGTNVFVISGMAYAGGGSNCSNIRLFDFYKYNPETNSWASIPGMPIFNKQKFSFSINGRGYIGHEDSEGAYQPMHKYTPKSCTILSPTQ